MVFAENCAYIYIYITFFQHTICMVSSGELNKLYSILKIILRALLRGEIKRKDLKTCT